MQYQRLGRAAVSALPPAAPSLSILIPALNEAAALPALLADIAGQQHIRCEVIVADGGSSDATLQIARRHRVRLLRTARGRGAQLNAAAAAARAPWLLCLHADSRLTAPDQLARALTLLRAEARQGKAVAGHWPLHFVREAAGHERLFRHLEAKTASNRPGTVNGDQGLLLHRDFFAVLGGFNAALPFFEDQRLAARIFSQGRFVLLPGLLHTSARRFEVEGHSARMALMALIVGADAAGLDDWLSALPALYRQQQEATRLSLAPFLQSLNAHIQSLPPARRRAVWRATGQLLVANGWQLAQALDLAVGSDSGRWLGWFDRHLARVLATPAATVLVARLSEGVITAAAKLKTGF